ncbi:hypothetical protein DH2020_034166 [Rehmannia glutinosa]|uniref:Retrotransposon Copia-like N-terminal domain-containing protein n=1 Tax=Rehmannia glutinosa TaxID=99300 RepID=A0ABR0VE43_REHGL
MYNFSKKKKKKTIYMYIKNQLINGERCVNDPNKPFFLPPSDNSHTIEIRPPLDGTNYTAWSRAFSLSISVKNKQGFLDGTILAPDFSDPLYIPWLRCNNLILTWLINSVTKEIASSIIYMNSAKEVWDT